MRKLKKENNILDESKYDDDITKIYLRIGYLNAQVIQKHKLKVLAQEFNELRQAKLKEKKTFQGYQSN